MPSKVLPIIFGISSTVLTEEEKDFLQKNPVVGFILFSRNIESKQQLIELNGSLRELYSERKVPILVDQEGGRVARIKPPIARELYPCAELFDNLYKINQEDALLAVKENYKKIMGEAKELGFDSICAPVCDLRLPGGDAIIGDRSFGEEPEQVIKLCNSVISAILEVGGIPFIKHMPGHGRANVDSHYEAPHVTTELTILKKTDFAVFKALADLDVWGMTAHIIFDALDSKNTVTLSKPAINYIREQIGFKGKLITDDVCMFALHGKVGAKKALLARLKKVVSANKPWQDEYRKSIVEQFNIDPKKFSNDAMLNFIEEKEQELQQEFLNSLASVSKLSMEAGCDYVLHCSGVLDEMKVVVEAVRYVRGSLKKMDYKSSQE